VLSIANNKVQIMDMETYETMELPVPEEEDLKNKVKPGVEVTYWDVMGTKQIKGLK